ncbi:MAG: DegT/DnrJ/EryC1/StrS family aminotransferase [Deltaproteobacteria bacterium]|nr:DegT/DnrJ/EryC1/StrS family aminotransferase [Deltaproteobacteria bacterium]MBW2073844.1 DegT/DnrJ/EryC1/StrS family aminotransferase [Deltaproteobacteria bacterium]RLB83111.1 MAG: DegT/DnrJ/EryC1/StrS family aminotransferase [Deltaproteobacteria bacterium]
MPGFEVFGEEEKREVLEVLDTGVLFRYEFAEQRKGVYKVAEFEKRFAEYCGAAYAQAVSSGTAALRVAMAALGISPGDEVITQGFTFVATWEAILDSGAVPVFTEVDETLTMDPEDLEQKITPRTRAIIPVHMLGAPARIEEIVAIADRHGIPVIEDTAQACGGTLNGRHLGTFGTMGIFSFDPVKAITTGEGGMIVTNDAALYRNCSEFHDHGHDHNPELERGLEGRRFIGFNYRMTELQGAIGLAQLAKLDDIIAAQRKHKAAIRSALEDVDGVTFRTIPDPAGDTATFLAFFLPDGGTARKFKKVLSEEKAGAIYFKENTWHFYPKWEHLHQGLTLCRTGWPFKRSEAGEALRYMPDNLPKSEAVFDRLLVYPISVKMSDDRLETIVSAVQKAASVVL